MTWSQFHERMAFMSDLINRATEDPEAALDFDGRLADVQRLFGSEEGLLLSLRERWVTMLAAKLDQAAYDDIPADRARAELAERHPGLRALLDAGALRSLRLRALQGGEQHIVEVFDGPPANSAARVPKRQTVA